MRVESTVLEINESIGLMSEELGNIYERYNHNNGFLYKPFSFHVISGSRDCILLGSMVGNRVIVKPKQGLYISYQKTE